jgi:CubicO group peptidase (beta-lactamase class C family)
MVRIGLLIICLLAGIAISGCSSSTGITRSDNYSDVKKEVSASLLQTLDKGGTSVSYAVIQNGNVVMADAVGYLDAAKKIKATTETLYNIGSLSKVCTTAVVMKLVDQGEIDLDDPVVKHLPDFKLKDSRYMAITVRMLLNHSSGMLGSDYTTGIVFRGYETKYYDQLRAYFEKSVLKMEPGKFSVYCNDGFEVAELLVAKVGGMPFDKFVDEKLFKPLGLNSAGYARRTFAPGSYAVKGSLPQEFPNVMGSGGVSTSLADLARFGDMFLIGGAGVLQPSSISEMSRPQGETFIGGDTAATMFGLGWDNVDPTFDDFDFGSGVLLKSGGTSQFTSYLYVIPKYNMSASISVTSDFSDDVSATLRNIVAKVLRTQGIETVRPAAMYTAALAKPLPVGFKEEYAGYYGTDSSFRKVEVNNDQTINMLQFDGTTFVTKFASLVYDGDAFAKASGEKMYRFALADGRRYLLSVSERQNKVSPSALKLEPATTPLGAWGGRLNRLYLPAEVAYNAVYLMSGLKLVLQDGLDGLIFIQDGENKVPLSIIDDSNTGIVLNISRDLSTLTVKTVNGEEWLANESYSLRPALSLAVVASGTVTIPASGTNSLYRIPSGTITFTVPVDGRVIAYDQSGNQAYDSFTQGVDFGLVPKSGFIRFVGLPEVQFTVSVSP